MLRSRIAAAARQAASSPSRMALRHASTSAAPSSSSSSASSSRIAGLALLGLAVGGSVAATRSASPIHLDGEPTKRRSYSDRLKFEKGYDGKKTFARKQEEEEKVEEEEEASADTPAGMEDLEEEAGQEAAFDPETNTINWDCPCLGGMAHGPCGEEFKDAFSCFVFSEKEPKGIECVEKFKTMQDCFRRHPEVYKEELKDDEWDEVEKDAEGAQEGQDLDVKVDSKQDQA